jgi:hypothetical protein
MKSWPAIAKQLLAISILSMAAYVASGWAMLYCYFFGSPVLHWFNDASLTILQEAPAPAELSEAFDMRGDLTWYLPGPAFTVIWGIGMAAYLSWVRQNAIGLSLVLIPAAAFLYFSWQQLVYAYPVCNGF